MQRTTLTEAEYARYQETLERFGDRVRYLRDYRGLTQAQVAERAGLSRATIANIEACRQNTTVVAVHQLCHAFGITPGQFFSDLEYGR